MSTLETFRAMSGLNQTSSLEITDERAQEIIKTILSKHREAVDGTLGPINLFSVSSYVTQAKRGLPGFSNLVPNLPPFAAHWGIVVGDPVKVERNAYLLHLVLEEDDAGCHRMEFAMMNVGSESNAIKGGEVKQVGHTRFNIDELTRIGGEMIKAFGNYHLVFWNCQMFAKCYLRVITGSDAAFSHWTSADVTNLFLCAFVIPFPVTSSLKIKEQRRMRALHGVGTQAANAQSGDKTEVSVTEDDLYTASDEAIHLMKQTLLNDEMLQKMSGSMKDSSDKRGLITKIRSLWQKITPS
jgi:hypothetical protein